jgi:hypothetical protein
MAGTLTSDKLADMRMAHLNVIQGVISRLSGFSANAKNFCVTITAALIAIIFDKELPQLAVAGCAVIVVLLFIDSYYLALERSFRNLYDEVRVKPLANAADFGLQAKPLTPMLIFGAILSTSIWPFYLALLACVIFFGYCLGHVERSQQSSQAHSGTIVPEQQAPAHGTERAPRPTGRVSEDSDTAGRKRDTSGWTGQPAKPNH